MTNEKVLAAIQDRTVESLSNAEFHFMCLIAKHSPNQKRSRAITNACTEFGCSRGVGNAYVKKFGQLHLLCLQDEKLSVLPEVCAVLKNLNPMKKIKSIFTSPIVEEIYRTLIRKYSFVNLETPLRVLTEMENVKHLFTESWHKDYFIKCAFDFVIFDRNGLPKLVLEYHGGGHEGSLQKGCDNFKRTILEEAGIPLRVLMKDESLEKFLIEE